MAPSPRPMLRCGDLILAPVSQSIPMGGAAIHLTVKEYRLAEILALRPGQAMTRDEVLAELYRSDPAPSAKSIEVFICHLRRKLWAASGGRDVIGTVPGRGYAMRAV